MGLRARRSKTPPAPVVHAQGSLGVEARIRELGIQRRAVIAKIIPLENAGVLVPEKGVTSPGHKRAAAIDLLNGSVAPFLAKEPHLNSGETLRDLRAEVETIDEALAIAATLADKLQREEAEARYQEKLPALNDAMRQIALCMIGLERALQARDDVAKAIRSKTPIAGDGFIFAGRLSNTGSQAYRFLEMAVNEGYLTHAEFYEAFKEAREHLKRIA